MNDTLVFWNRNDASPRLMKRKVEIGHDTICHLLSADYYVKSHQNGSMNYIVFRTLNTNYQIENRYFETSCRSIPRFVKAKVEFENALDGEPIVNTKGKLLTRCNIVGQPTIRKPFNYWWIPIALLIISGALIRIRKTEKKSRNLHIESGLGGILLGAIIATYVYHRIETKRENQNMIATAESLLKKRDENFEASYKLFADKIKEDTIFREMLFSESNVLADVVMGYAKELLFDETMKGYVTSLTVCAPKEEITIQPEGYDTDCDNYFLEKLANNKQKRVGDGLYFIDYYTLDPNYLGKTCILSADSMQQKTLYFEFYKPIAPEGFSFPQMLQKADNQNLHDYSVANFRDNILVYKYGKYIYPNFQKSLNIKDREFTWDANYKHYSIKESDTDALVVSAPQKSFTQITAPFALFFLCLVVPYLLIIWLIIPKQQHTWRDRTLRQRLQNIILITLGVSAFAVVPFSLLFMRNIYNQKTTDTQFETTRTLANEIQNDIDIAPTLRTASRDTWTEILQHYAANFFTDLNLYNYNGRLIATTRPEILEMHLQAPIMNAEAYQNMYRNKALYYTHEEHLGKGVYESTYIPLNDANGNTLAYLNTPYFSSVTDLHNEMLNFILTYLNIILIILGIALIVVLRLTKRLTEPLSLIQANMRGVKIDQKNEPIEWNRNDEIGALVKQYNQLIVELEKSAAELKRTTTESAWRGVARQVAHEIKNSLTPMRLSVQLLQRKMDSGNATPEQIQRTTHTLIEQIDALSDIASSFSTYAKLPENHPQPLDLAELVGNVVNLYNNAENIEFHYDYDKEKDHTFNGDKTHLNSAVSNLVKNATQAIGSKPDGRIDVELKSTETQFIISVKDNGKGIKEEDKDRIFLPNFTTKTGGSGVGLSLTYNIVTSAGGTISFESQEGEGAKFEIVLPKTMA
ncbi:MAG: HAMP domain-containing histidine kinase [Bacteroidales bacterium]|nr:HAMP domain-containing histidine kinase [Bacteroidales bacterium]